ncbi:MAG TPA: ROK family protein [Anaerolineales bacterium]|nr:ROK family protein [Anaerolineales bacterium]
MMLILGVDFGGSGIKGAPVDSETGALLAPRYRVPTPDTAKPRPVAEAVAQIARNFTWEGPIGCGYPGVVRQGVTLTAANISKRWVGLDAEMLLGEATGCPVHLINDADAAGLAEMTFGAGRGREGVVLVVTIGTGLGTALFTNGQLVPNCEFGHLKIDGEDAEAHATDAARQREDLTWKKWASHFDRFLRSLEELVWPDLIILGGGVSKHHEEFIPRLTVQAEVVPAQLLNEAGIVGAALSARTAAA